MWQKSLESPYVLALLVGVYPIVFYFSNNWYIYDGFGILVRFGAFSLMILVALSSYYLVLSWLVRKIFNTNASRIVQRLFVLVSILVVAYLLRHTLSQIVANRLYLSLIIVSIALVLGWFSPKIQIFRLNIVFMILCLLSLGSGLYSIITTPGTNTLVGKGEDQWRQTIYDQVQFSKKPNVYYLVPDGFPNREA